MADKEKIEIPDADEHTLDPGPLLDFTVGRVRMVSAAVFREVQQKAIEEGRFMATAEGVAGGPLQETAISEGGDSV